MRRRAPRALFEEARVALEEVDVVEEVERQRAKVEEGGQESPVLLERVNSVSCVQTRGACTWLLKKTARTL